MKELEKKLRHARPKLRQVSPLSYWICVGFIAINFVIGLGLILLFDERDLRTPLLIVNGLFTFKFWGLTFIGLGIGFWYALASNRWKFLKALLFIAVIVKGAWLVMLIHRTFLNPSTIIWSSVWAFFTYIQSVVYIFLPIAEDIGRHE